MTYNLEAGVSKALGQLLINETDYNVIFHIGETPNYREFRAHSNILRCRSEYLNKLLSAYSNEFIELVNGIYIIRKPSITPQAFEVALKYLYTGHINLSNKSGTELLDIMIASDELNVRTLTILTEDFIIKNSYQFLKKDPVGVLQTIFCYKSFTKLQDCCLQTICLDPELLFNSNKFVSLPAHLLEIILRRDDLSFSEIRVWEYVIIWGLAQGQVHYQEDLKRVLSKLIPLIRFNEISSQDYVNKVKPYEEILPEDVREELSRFYIITGHRPTSAMFRPRQSIRNVDSVDSVIINKDSAVLFANWIENKRGSEKYNFIRNIPYKFNLLYRASRDGNTAAAFHKKCDDKGATIIVIKLKDSERVVGGYNPLDWDSSNRYKSTTNSFIFSFTDRSNIQSAKVGYSNGNRYSIVCFSSTFGYNDLYHHKSRWYGGGSTPNNPNPNASYPKLEGIPRGGFGVDDYEVFQVVNKNNGIDRFGNNNGNNEDMLNNAERVRRLNTISVKPKRFSTLLFRKR